MPGESTAVTVSADVLRRRGRILDAAYDLAEEGGFDAVQMRAVADRGEVALGTLYRYYPSKTHLLVATFRREFEAVAEDLRARPVAEETPVARVVQVLERVATRLRRDLQLADAMTRAFLLADSAAAPEVTEVEALISTMLVRALLQDPAAELADAPPETVVTARVIRDVWLAALVGWSAGRHTSLETQSYMAQAVQRVLG